jgi:hypothetical protein
MTSPVSKANSRHGPIRVQRADTIATGRSATAQIVFIDGAVAGAQALAAGIRAGVVAVILDPGRDGVR